MGQYIESVILARTTALVWDRSLFLWPAVLMYHNKDVSRCALVSWRRCWQVVLHLKRGRLSLDDTMMSTALPTPTVHTPLARAGRSVTCKSCWSSLCVAGRLCVSLMGRMVLCGSDSCGVVVCCGSNDVGDCLQPNDYAEYLFRCHNAFAVYCVRIAAGTSGAVIATCAAGFSRKRCPLSDLDC